MKITIENTNVIRTILVSGAEVPARVWMGKTESGIQVQCLITRIAAPSTENLAQFDRELSECRAPEEQVVFPLRMVL